MFGSLVKDLTGPYNLKVSVPFEKPLLSSTIGFTLIRVLSLNLFDTRRETKFIFTHLL